MKPASKTRRVGPLVLVWALLVVVSFGGLSVYSQTPGEISAPPRDEALAESTSDSEAAWRLVMAIHPKCPCTRASLAELEKLLAREPERFRCEVLIYQPDDQPEPWIDTETVRVASALRGVTVSPDIAATRASRMGILTSGGVVLFDPAGAPRFYGGITPSRNHQGDNVGSVSILALLRGSRPAAHSSPVYGCSILGQRTEQR